MRKKEKNLNLDKKLFHNIICSYSCDHERHEELGFSSTLFSFFYNFCIFNFLDDGIKKYIDYQFTLFEKPFFNI
ncbi:MAG: hypothetical protein TYPL_0170 [Candidatus Tyloplasma litorale]|nr:MAG: hypothetical protein TYPL_0170 [Mycoplasmatales bacterium]